MPCSEVFVAAGGVDAPAPDVAPGDRGAARESGVLCREVAQPVGDRISVCETADIEKTESTYRPTRGC